MHFIMTHRRVGKVELVVNKSRVGVAVKESALVAVSGKNRHYLHHQHTAADNAQSVGAIQAVDESDDVD